MSANVFLTGVEVSVGQTIDILKTGLVLAEERKQKLFRQELRGQTLVLLFEKPSLRTHLSFSIAAQELGLNVVESYSSQRKSEEPEDVGRVVEGYCDAIMLRTFQHETLNRMAAKISIPLINGLSDSHHPCQILADALTLLQNFGSLNGLNLAYVGDGNNILHSLLLMLPRLGVSVTYACPAGFEPHADIVQQARGLAKESGAKIKGYSDPKKAVAAAHAIYTDVWTSMGFEAEQASRDQAFRGFQVNAQLLALADKDCIVLHCLPMVRGKELSHEMVDHPRSRIFQQSQNRLHAQKALLLAMMGENKNV